MLLHGATLTSQAQSGNWTGQLVLAQDAAGIQDIRILNDNALLTVANNLLDANEANTLITNGSSDIRQSYAMAKWQYWNDRVPTFILSGTADNLNPVVGGSFVFNEDTNDISGTQFDYHSSTSVDLETGSVTATNISGTSSGGNNIAVRNGTLRAAGTLDLQVIDLQDAITIDGGTVTNPTAADFAVNVDLVNSPNINVGDG